MTTAARPGPPPARLLSWLVGCLVAGWLIVYNALRIGGDSPSDAATPALAGGAVLGIGAFAVGVLVARRMAASGRVVRGGAAALPSPDRIDDTQRDAIRLAWPPLAALAVVALGVGAYLGADWFSSDAASRPKTTAILAAWNLLVGLWLGDEALRLSRGDIDGIESTVLGCGLTAAMAGVGIGRDLIVPGQIALIVLSGIAGALVALAVWRLQGARGAPVGAVGAVIVAALALVLPLAF